MQSLLLHSTDLQLAGSSHWLTSLQSTQTPAPLQTLPPNEAHGVSFGSGRCDGTSSAPSHPSLVQSFPSLAATSSTSLITTVPPIMSHTTILQSLSVCPFAAVPGLAAMMKH